MDLMAIRHRLLMGQEKKQIINLCPAATGTEIVQKFRYVNPNLYYDVTGLDSNKYYTLQATWTKTWAASGAKRLYCIGESTSTMIRPTGAETVVPFTKTVTTKPNANGVITLRASRTGLTNTTDGAEYAASMINIMLEEGTVAHPFVPYVGEA